MDNRKDFWIAIVIALIGGCIGLQHFYVGQKWWGVIAIFFSWTYIPILVSSIQALIWLFGGKDEFNKKFNSETNNN